MQLVVDKIAKAFGIHEIFKDVSFMVEQGEHVGLVGVNGSGKTTLLRCLLQPEWVDSGAVKFEPGISVGYVQQGFTDIRGTIWQFMQTACPEIGSLRQKLAQLEADSGKLQGEKLDSCLEEYGRVLKRYEFIDGYNYENRIKRVLIGLGYTEDWWQHDAATLSGGQKTRLMLAAALVGVTGCDLAVRLVQYIIVSIWAYAESIVELRKLLAGETIALIKNRDNWILQLSSLVDEKLNLQSLINNITSYEAVNNNKVEENGRDNGIGYKEYLKLLIMFMNKSDRNYRIAALMELRMIMYGHSGFRMKNYIYAAFGAAHFKMNGTGSVYRQKLSYSYI